MAQIHNGKTVKYLQVRLTVEEHRLIHMYSSRIGKSVVEIGRQLIERGGLKELLEAAKIHGDDAEEH